MWVKGSLLQFIVDNGSQKNLISEEVVNQLRFSTTTHPHLYTIGWLHQGRDLRIIEQCHLPYSIKPFTDEVLCDVDPIALFHSDERDGGRQYYLQYLVQIISQSNNNSA